MQDLPIITAVPGRPRRLGPLRRLVRAVMLVAVIILVLPLVPWPSSAMLPLAASPYVAVAGAIAARSLGLVTLVAVPIMVLAILRRRFFCRWLCPTGLLAELAGRLHWWGPRRALRLPPLGQWIVILTVAGAVLGYPLLLWLDPLAMLAGAVGAVAGPTAGTWAALSAAALGAVLVLSLLWPGTWCLRICPLGATQELLHLPVRLARERQEEEEEAAAVAGNGDDENSLPPAPKDLRAWPLARRSVLTAAAGLGAAALARRAGAQTPLPLRPPGAVEADHFAGLCIRCGNCVRVCPAGILHPDLGEHGVLDLLAPVVRITTDYCRETCDRCGQVCPSGAIRRFAVSEKPQTRIGVAVFNPVICMLTEEKECGICKGYCSYDAITLVFSEVDYLLRVKVDADKCPGCGACQVACPTSPEKAIVVVPLASGDPGAAQSPA